MPLFICHYLSCSRLMGAWRGKSTALSSFHEVGNCSLLDTEYCYNPNLIFRSFDLARYETIEINKREISDLRQIIHKFIYKKLINNECEIVGSFAVKFFGSVFSSAKVFGNFRYRVNVNHVCSSGYF